MDPGQHEYLFDATGITPCVKCEAEWALRWVSEQESTFTECHCKILRDNIKGIMRPANHCLARCGGVKHVLVLSMRRPVVS